MNPTEAQDIVVQNASQLKQFMDYLSKGGTALHVIEAIAKALLGSTIAVEDLLGSDFAAGDPVTSVEDQNLPVYMFRSAINEVMVVNQNTGDATFNLHRLIDGAAAFELLVRYARKVDSKVLRPADVPSAKIVEAVLALSHARRAVKV